MTGDKRNLPASVTARLLNCARQTELHTALMPAAVTGKIDVRGEAAA